DLYDLFAQALTLTLTGGPRVHVLVRSRHNRRLQGRELCLWGALGRRPLAGQLKVRVGRRGEQPARLATLSIRFSPATLAPPRRKASQPTLAVWAVEAREMRPPKGVTPILWRLVTTLPVTGVEEALEKVAWYAQRWQIEVLHKVLKSGCQIEQRQLETAARLERVLSVDLVVAWRLLALWQAVRWIAQLGGFMGRKHDGEPGPITLWRGLHRLNDLTAMWQLCHDKKQRRKCGES